MKPQPQTAAPQFTKTPSQTTRLKQKALTGYADIQHFYKSSLKYTRVLEKDLNPAYELGYN